MLMMMTKLGKKINHDCPRKEDYVLNKSTLYSSAKCLYATNCVFLIVRIDRLSLLIPQFFVIESYITHVEHALCETSEKELEE